MGQHDLPDDLLRQKASATVERLLQHLQADTDNAGQAVEGLSQAIKSLESLRIELEKESPTL